MELRVRFTLSAIDTSLLASGNVGDYFQKFCSEFFARHYQGAGHSSRPGVDGAIDGWFEDEGRIAYWDSKYVGEDDDETIEKRWKDVASVFHENLRSETPASSQYAPWYSSTRPVRFYHFCVSARFANKARRDELQRKIEIFFRKLAQRSGLEHLAVLSARVWDWDDFETALSAFPGLLLRWFLDQRPTGWMPLSSVQHKGSGFESYLREQVLPYFSLAAYKQLEPNSDILDEDGWLTEFEKHEANGFVITGTGGIGKTRLMYELGWLAHKRGWVVLVATGALLKPGALRDVVIRADDEAKRLLLVDYAETRSDFAELWDVASELNIAGRMVRVLATSRHTSVRRLSELVTVRWIEMSPVNAKDWFARYRRAVTEHILQQTGMQPSEHNIAEFSESPVLAVFAYYLSQLGRGANLETLLGEPRFEEYLKKRVRISFPGKHNAIDDIARLLAQMPFEQEVVDTLDAGLLEVWKALMSDHWVDFRETSEKWYTVHDLFADTLLQCYFREVFQQRQNDLIREVEALFDLARRLGTTTSCLTAIERVRETPGLHDLDWGLLFGDQIRQHAREWSRARIALLQSPLITAEEKLDQIRDSLAFWEGVEFEPEYEQAVMSIGLECTVRHKHMQQATTDMLVTLYRWGITAQNSDNKLATHSLRVLSPGSAVDPLVLDLIKKEAQTLQNDFPLVAWLNSGRSHEVVRTQVRHWLNNFSSIYTAAYLIVGWLKASENPRVEKPAVINWMNRHGKRAAAVFVLSAWIRYCGDTSTFSSESCNWLRRNPKTASAGYLYVAWLNASGGVDPIRAALRNWLVEHHAKDFACFVYCAWLNAGGAQMLVQEPIRAWLANHLDKEAAGFVCSAWLGAGGEKTLVQEQVQLWLREYQESEAARSVYAAWLRNRGDTALVQESIRLWLGKHQESEEARMVYITWLNAGGDKALVQESIRLWLCKHQESGVARAVYEAWLNTGGDKALVQESIRLWLGKHQEHGVARAVYVAWLSNGGDKALVQESIRLWLCKHQETGVAQAVYEAWLNTGGDKALVQESIRLWLAKHQEHGVARAVYVAWLSNGGDTALMQEPIRLWLGKHPEGSEAGLLSAIWLNAGGDRAIVEEPIRLWFCEDQDNEAAQLVYAVWLSAGGDKNIVHEPARLWLAKNRESQGANFIYPDWIKAGGDRAFVQESIRPWLSKLQETKHAQAMPKNAIFGHIRGRSRKQLLSEEDLRWIAEQCSRADVKSDPEVLFSFPPFTADIFRQPGGQQLIEVLVDAVTYHVKSQHLDRHSAKHLTRLFAFLIDGLYSLNEMLFHRIKKALILWVRNKRSFTEKAPSEKAPIPRLAHEIALLISTGELDALTDSFHLERVFAWTARCDERQIEVIREIVEQYLIKCPEKSALWNSWHDALSGDNYRLG